MRPLRTIRSSEWWESWWEPLPSFEVHEDHYPGHSKLLDQHGNPIPYESPKQGFVGFRKLRG